MFRENLLESAPPGHRRTRWSMAIAFTLELIVAGVLIVLPLLSSSVISVSAHVQRVAPLGLKDVPRDAHAGPTSDKGGIRVGRPIVVPIATLCFRPCLSHYSADVDDPSADPRIAIGQPDGIMGLFDPIGRDVPPAQPRLQRVRVSQLSEGLLANRVEPVYPRIATLTHIQGQVRLHAIIARDGSIQSLDLISGHPLLALAAEDAVKQWRYQPYLLNGEPVEVETFITVNFKATRD